VHLVRLGRLKNELIEQKLSEHQTFPYFLVILIFDGILINHSFAFPSSDTFSDMMSYLQVAVPVIILTVSTLLLYKVNGGATGKYFYIRYFPLAWVVGVRFTPLAIAVFSVWLYYVAKDENYLFGWREILLWNSLYALYYWRVWVHMRDVRQRTYHFDEK